MLLLLLLVVVVVAVVTVDLCEKARPQSRAVEFGRGDDTFGKPHRAQVSQSELFDLKVLKSSFSSLYFLLKLDKQFPVEQFKATVSQSIIPPLLRVRHDRLRSSCVALSEWIDEPDGNDVDVVKRLVVLLA